MDSMLSLSEAKKYLSGNMKRPLWDGEKGVDDPLFTALCNSEDSFNSSLHQHLNRWAKNNKHTITKDDKNDVLYPQTFLDDFAIRRNIPNPPSGYGVVEKFNVKGIIKNRIGKPAESLEAKLGPIGVKALDQKGCAQTAFPIAFLEIMQGVIEEHPSLKKDHLIAKAVLEYMEYLDAAKTTEACMDVSSLALQKKNLEAFRESGLFEQLIEQLTQ
jgi:hypothetical protein